ncbi:MAG: hypothetical protein RL264_617 [Bacteroidota bacterium]
MIKMNRMKLIFTICFLLFTRVFFSQELPDKYANFYNSTFEMDFKSKVKLLNKTIKENPKDPWYLWMLASVYEMQNEPKKVVENYEKSIKIDPNFSAGYASLARFYYTNDTTRLDTALTYINNAIELSPNADYFYIDQGRIYLLQKKYDLAIKSAEQELLKPEANTDEVYEIIVKSLYAQKKMEELNSLLKRVDLSNGWVYDYKYVMMLGVLYGNLGDLKKSCNCFEGLARDYEETGQTLPADLVLKLKKCKK